MQQTEALSAAHPVYLGVTSFWKASFYWCSFYWTVRVTLCRFSLQHLAMVSASVSIFIRMSRFSEVALPLSSSLPPAKRLWMRSGKGESSHASAAWEPREQIWELEVKRLQWIPLTLSFLRLFIHLKLPLRKRENQQPGWENGDGEIPFSLRHSDDVGVGEWWVWCGEEVLLALDLMKVLVDGMLRFERELSAPTPPVVRHIKASRSVLGALTFLLAGSHQHLPFLICAQIPPLPLRLMHCPLWWLCRACFCIWLCFFCYWGLSSWTQAWWGFFCLFALHENSGRHYWQQRRPSWQSYW